MDSEPKGTISRKFQEGEGPPGLGQQLSCLLQPIHLAESKPAPPAPPGGCGLVARSQLVPGTVLQGLLQGLGHSVHILPGGIAAQEANPQHLPQGRPKATRDLDGKVVH